LHPPPVVRHREGRLGGVGGDADAGGAGVEGVGDHLREDRLLEGAAVGVAEIFEQMPQVDARLAHGPILSSRPAGRTSPPHRSYQYLPFGIISSNDMSDSASR